MDYFAWNNLICDYFFNPTHGGEDVYLYLTKQDVIDIGKPQLEGLSNVQVWQDFINAVTYGELPTDEARVSYACLPIRKPYLLYGRWNKNDLPPFLTYLVLYIIPLT